MSCHVDEAGFESDGAFTLGRSLRRRFVGDRLSLLKDPVFFGEDDASDPGD